MIVRNELYLLDDILCDRCGKSLVGMIRRKVGPLWFDNDSIERFISRLISEHEVVGWRFNPRNQTIVCPDCALIINKKGSEE